MNFTHFTPFILFIFSSLCEASADRTDLIIEILKEKRSSDLLSEEIYLITPGELDAIQQEESKLESGKWLSKEALYEILNKSSREDDVVIEVENGEEITNITNTGVDVVMNEGNSGASGSGDSELITNILPMDVVSETNTNTQYPDENSHHQYSKQEPPSFLNRLRNKKNASIVAVIGTVALAGGLFITFTKH